MNVAQVVDRLLTEESAAARLPDDLRTKALAMARDGWKTLKQMYALKPKGQEVTPEIEAQAKELGMGFIGRHAATIHALVKALPKPVSSIKSTTITVDEFVSWYLRMLDRPEKITSWAWDFVPKYQRSDPGAPMSRLFNDNYSPVQWDAFLDL
ncbi:MAG: hypothetical protein A2580_14345 [Hydrogenophilales bacterium RIFOXYD1_FULL_62_11]|nr:MAG: hypothetical protein A2580_14345 [Hydrogenophilales bacterium RIFOXYD1_FULL_62_11]